MQVEAPPPSAPSCFEVPISCITPITACQPCHMPGQTNMCAPPRPMHQAKLHLTKSTRWQKGPVRHRHGGTCMMLGLQVMQGMLQVSHNNEQPQADPECTGL